jgi:hypothetical protein
MNTYSRVATALVQKLAERHGAKGENVSALVNATFAMDFAVKRYYVDGKEKFLVLFGDKLVSAIRNGDVEAGLALVETALGTLKNAQTVLPSKVPSAQLVSASDFDLTFSVSARHRATGVVLERHASRPFNDLSMVSSIQEEMSTILATIIQRGE